MDYILPFEAIAIDGTAAQAFASHSPRASAVAEKYARDHPLRDVNGVLDEDRTIILISHFRGFDDHLDYRVPKENQKHLAAEAVEALKRLEMGHGRVGTSIDEEIILGMKLKRNGDYDMGLKGLMVIVYRYRHFLTDDDLKFVLDRFIPSGLKGAHDPSHESYRLFEFEEVPETENHLLMINSTKYLVNQLLFDRTGEKTYDNSGEKGNGLANWLLHYMHTIAKHDFLEFNSRPYQRLSLHALLNLYEFGRDKSIRTAARILLDYTMMKFAVSSNRLRRINPFRRLKEFVNLPTNEHNHLLEPQSQGKDALIGFFLMYTGPTDINGNPTENFPARWGIEALIAGLATYRPPVAAYELAIKPDLPIEAFQHRFYHGNRPILRGADEQAEGGLEIYYSSPSFLLSAGGTFLNSGYGKDEFIGYKQTAIAQSTTLLPTKADVRFADLIRFDPYPDERRAVNTAVHKGFACGANLRPAEKKVFTDTSTHGPVLSSYGEQLFFGWKGSGNEHLNAAKVYTTDKFKLPGVENLDEKAVLGDTSDQSPAIAFHNGRLFMAWKGAGNENLNLIASDIGKMSFSIKKTFADTSPYAPALVSHNGQLFLAWTGVGEGKLNVAKVTLSDRGGLSIDGLEGKIVLGDTSEQSPAIATHNGRLFLAWKGTGNNNLNLMFSDPNGTSFPGKMTFADTSPFAPAIASHNGRLFFAWTGIGEGKLNVAKVTLFGNTAGGFGIEGLEGKVVLADTSERAPALASYNGRLFLAWKGAGNDNLNLLLSHDGLFQTERWIFLNLSDMDLYIAIYRTPPAESHPLDAPLENLGLLYAYDLKTASPLLDFETFKRLTLERNASLPEKLAYKGTYVFHTADDHQFNFLLQPSLDKYKARVFRMDDQEPVTDFTSLPLVEGPYLASPGGHEGYIEISHPGCETPLVLDFTEAGNPIIEENILACPRSWIDRAQALFSFALTLSNTGRPEDGARATRERIQIYEHLNKISSGKHRSELASALFWLLHYYRAWTASAPALTFGQHGLELYEELAGIRTPGSKDSVDYELLDNYSPNEYWDWPYLSGALHNLAWVNREIGDHPAAAAWTAKRIKLYERLVKEDSTKHQPALAAALFEQLHYHRGGLETTSALAFAKQGLEVYESLAGLRPSGSQEAVSYEQLGNLNPNEYWDWPFLSGALYNLAWVNREAGDHPTALEWMLKRVKVYERLNQMDSAKYASALAQAQADVAIFNV